MYVSSFVSKSNFLLAKDACIKVAYYIVIIIDSDILSIFMWLGNTRDSKILNVGMCRTNSLLHRCPNSHKQ